MTKHRTNIFTISLIVALGGFLMGFDASVISGVVKFIDAEFQLTDIQLGWAVGSLTLAATFSMLVSGKLSDKFGRRKVLSVAALLYAVSAALSAVAPSFTFLVIARMIGGLGVGASLIIAPMYIAEIAPAKKRGMLVSFNQLNIVLGISVAFFTNYLILKWSNSDGALAGLLNISDYQWRWMLFVETIPAVIYFIALFFVPRSPRWLVMNDKYTEAKVVMVNLLGNSDAENEIETIKASLKGDSKKSTGSFITVFKPAYRNVLVIGVVLALLQQLVGINAVFFYAPMIFEQSGFSTDAAFAQAIFVGLTNLIFTILAMWLIDKIGRRLLLLIGTIGITISMFIISYAFSNAVYSVDKHQLEDLSHIESLNKLSVISGKVYNSEKEFLVTIGEILDEDVINDHKSEIIAGSINLNTGLVLFGLIAFVASFAVSVGPVMWVMFSELFPNFIRAVAVSFVGVINSLTSFLVQLVFPWELANMGSSTTFLVYGIIAFAGMLFIISKVPETKGKTLEELQLILTKS